MIITQKAWSEDEVRINSNTKCMNDYVVKTDIPIPTTEVLRHELEDSNRFSTLDTRDAFYHFLLSEESQELFNFHGVNGVYHFLVVVMGTPHALVECHTAMSKYCNGLKGVLVIKDDILIHGKGQDHDENLYDYGIRLRKETCKLGQQAVMWFLPHIHRECFPILTRWKTSWLGPDQ